MGHNQPMQSNSQGQFYQIPLDIEHNSTNQTNSSWRHYRWLTIIICIILAVTGQCIARLLENYYFLHRSQSLHYGISTQSLLQVVGFPLLILPFIIFLLSSKKNNKLLIFTIGISRKQLAIKYFVLFCYMFSQAIFSNSKYRIPFRVFTLIYTTQLLFTPFFSIFVTKIKFNRWMVISLILAIITGAFTLYTFSAGSPIYNRKKPEEYGDMFRALFAAIFFSVLLCYMRSIFVDLISICNEPSNRKQPSFVVVFELLIITSFFATIFLLIPFFISGENHDLKRHMYGFLKGEMAYVRTIIGQVVAWQVYWVGIVGLVFVVSPVFSTVVSVCTWPVVSLLVAFAYNNYGGYHVLSLIALATAALSIASYFYLIHKEKSEGDIS